MMGQDKGKPYRIIGAYDSETCNVSGANGIYAYPVLHQLGLLDCDISQVSAENIEDHAHIELYRHSVDLFCRLDDLADGSRPYVPVICCHNLAFDMYGLSPYLAGRDKVKVLAKSCRKPITFTICDAKGKPALVLWDTLIFSQQSLNRMGEDCGYAKAVGEWDYELIRTPETPLTDDEIDYACKDVYALLAWLGWWIKRNPDIDASDLGKTVLTKTGVVRQRRKIRFANIRSSGNKYTIGKYWHWLNKQEQPKTDFELFEMMAATRGGFTFCASSHASEVYDLQGSYFSVVGYDATSQHPAQMVSHNVPVDFHEATEKALDNVFKICARTSLSKILKHWDKPFSSAVYACYEFENIRPKPNSLYAQHGIMPLASARFAPETYETNEDNEDNTDFKRTSVCRDTACNPVFAFGKLICADTAQIYLTELGIWEVAQAYTWDSVKPLHGYMTGRFVKPSDMAIVSVMQFYKAKNLYKIARSDYYAKGSISKDLAKDLISNGIPEFIAYGMKRGDIPDGDVESTYLGLKANINALYGIECSNEYRRDTILTETGIGYTGNHGLCNAPNNPKAHYQFGQRIVGWSRIAQHAAMQLLEPYAIDIINGDTDSIKIMISDDLIDAATESLSILGNAIDSGKDAVCKRIRDRYPDLYDQLDGIGWYVPEFAVKRFCASWNKAYCMQESDKRDGKDHISFTIAGIPTKKINVLADRLYDDGMGFDAICDIMLGYNVTFAYDLLHLHSRCFPDWGDIGMHRVKDYRGNQSTVIEPAALALFPMSKTINDTRNRENAANLEHAMLVRPTVNDIPCIVSEGGIYGLEMER